MSSKSITCEELQDPKNNNNGHGGTDSETGSESSDGSSVCIKRVEGAVRSTQRSLDFHCREQAYASISDKSMVADVLGEEAVEKKDNESRPRRPEMISRKVSGRCEKNPEEPESAKDDVPKKSGRGLDRSTSSRRVKSPTRTKVLRTVSDGSTLGRSLPIKSRSGQGKRPQIVRRAISIGDRELDEKEFEKALSQESSRRDLQKSPSYTEENSRLSRGSSKRDLRAPTGSRQNLASVDRQGSRREVRSPPSRAGPRRNFECDREAEEEGTRLSREGSRREIRKSPSRAGSRSNLLLGKDEPTDDRRGRLSRECSKKELRGPPSRAGSRRNMLLGDGEGNGDENNGGTPQRRVATSRSFRQNRGETRDRLRKAASCRELDGDSKHGGSNPSADREGHLSREGSYRRQGRSGDPEKRRGVGRTRSQRKDGREVARSQYAAAIDAYARQEEEEEEKEVEEDDDEEGEPEDVGDDMEEENDETDDAKKRSSTKKSLFGLASSAAKGMTKVAKQATKSVVPRKNKEEKESLLGTSDEDEDADVDSAAFLLDNSSISGSSSRHGVATR